MKEADPKIVKPFLREKMEDIKTPQALSITNRITRPVNIRKTSGLVLPRVIELEEQLDKKQNLLSSLDNSAFSAAKITYAKCSDDT